MKFGNRLLGGASALAQTAAALIDDESSGAGAADDEAPNNGPEDEEDAPDDEEVKPAGEAEAAAPPPPAAAEPPSGAAAEGEPLNLTAEQRQYFDMGTAAGVIGRNADIAEVFSARVKGADGKDGELVVAGREQAAAELLAAGLTAEQTVKTLGKLPKGSHGDAMLDTLRAQAEKTPSLSPSGEGGGGNQAASVWDRTAKKLGWTQDK